MPNVYFIGALLVAFVLAVAGAGWKGFELGGNAKQVEWDAANLTAAKSVEADRKAQDDKARKSASVLEKKLATQAITSRELSDALSRQLAKKPLPPECVVDAGLLDIWNRANSGQSFPAGELPATSGGVAATGKPVP